MEIKTKETKLIKCRFVNVELKKTCSTLHYFVNRVNKIEGSETIPSIQSIKAKVRRIRNRAYTLDLSIREHKIYNERIMRFYTSLKNNGLLEMDNVQLSKFPFDRMKITKAGTISFNQ